MSRPQVGIGKPIDQHAAARGSISGNCLSRSFGAPPKIFFNQLLAESLEITGAVAGQVWALNDIGQLARIGATDPEQFQPFECVEVVDRHRALLSQALSDGKSSTTPFRDAALDGQDRLIHLAPLDLQDQTVGIVELILDRPLDPTQTGFFQALCRTASRYLNERATRVDVRQPSGDLNRQTNKELDCAERSFKGYVQERAKEGCPRRSSGLQVATERNSARPVTPHSPSDRDVEEFLLLLHNQADLDYVAATTVNEIRRLFGCDRVCLATESGTACEIKAISGQDMVVSKSNAVRALQKLSAYVIRTGGEIRFESESEVVSDESFELLADFINEAGVTWLRIMPLFAPEKIDFESNLHVAERIAFGALIIEQFSGKSPPDVQRVDRLACHTGLAVWHALQSERIFLMPLRRRIGEWSSAAQLTRSRLLVGAGLILLAAGLLTFVRAPYNIPAAGRLMPVNQFRAYAPFNAVVQSVHVEGGQQVQANQVLVEVHGEELATRALIVANNLAEKQKLLAAHKSQLDGNSNQREDSAHIALSAKIAQISLEIEGLLEQQQLTTKLVEQSLVRSPMSGRVATFQPRDLLTGRPVSRGELLLEVMDADGVWQIELQVPERRLGHLLAECALGDELAVEFVSATDPERTSAATITRISNRVTIAEDGRPSMPVCASISPDSNLQCTIGAEVNARIRCGRRSLGYVWFGDVVDWVCSRF